MNTHVVASLDMRRALKDGTFPVIIRISHKGATTSINTGIKLLPKDWDEKKRAVKTSYTGIENSSRLNARILKVQSDLTGIIQKLHDGGELQSLALKDLMSKLIAKPSVDCFFKYTEAQIQIMNTAGRFGTARGYISLLSLLKKFRDKPTLPFQEITVQLLKSLETDYLSRGNSLNGLASYLRSMRALYNRACVDGLADRTKNPFQDYKIRKTQTVKRAISQDSINRILDLDVSQEDKLFHTRNYFLFSYLTFGMNFSDMAWLKVGDIRDGRIKYIRKKTKQVFDIKVVDALQPIIDHYAKNKNPEDFILPIIKRTEPSEQYKDILWAIKYHNQNLREMAKLCGITEHLTTYAIRHSAATLAMYLGIPVPAISRLLGHNSISTTNTYLKSLPDAVIDDYHSQLIDNMGKKK